MYHALFKITPTFVRDLLVKKFVQMPPWRKTVSGSCARLPAEAASENENPPASAEQKTEKQN